AKGQPEADRARRCTRISVGTRARRRIDGDLNRGDRAGGTASGACCVEEGVGDRGPGDYQGQGADHSCQSLVESHLMVLLFVFVGGRAETPASGFPNVAERFLACLRPLPRSRRRLAFIQRPTRGINEALPSERSPGQRMVYACGRITLLARPGAIGLSAQPRHLELPQTLRPAPHIYKDENRAGSPPRTASARPARVPGGGLRAPVRRD